MSDAIVVETHAHISMVAALPAHRVLVVANQTATSLALVTELQDRIKNGPVELHLVVPALNSHLRHWLSDTDDAVSVARNRGEDAVKALGSHGIPVTVEIGDSVPLLAIGDALAQFDADEIVISTLPAGRSHWLEHNLVDRARNRFDIPVRHVIAAQEAVLAA